MKKIPMRQCIGCREMKSKKEMTRIIRTPDGEVLIDPTGKKNGRGAYICQDPECLKKAVKTNALSRALSIPVSEDTINRLVKELN